MQPGPGLDGISKILHIVKEFYGTGIDDHLQVFGLLVLIVADIALGFSRAWATNSISSNKLRKGIISHVSMFIAVAIAYPYIVYMGLTQAVDAFIYAMFVSYALSILKNLSVLGVKIPYIEGFITRNIDHHKDIYTVDIADYLADQPQEVEPIKTADGPDGPDA